MTYSIKLRRLAAPAVALLLAACASEPKEDVSTWDRPPPGVQTAPPPITPADLMKSLGLTERPADELGAIERTFNSCALNQNVLPCTTRFVTLIHFQLLCRDTEGTVSDAPIRPQPIGTDDVRWNVGELKGASRTDDRGYGQIIALSDQSLLEQRLTLRLGAKFLGLTVGEITKVVLPNNFCASR